MIQKSDFCSFIEQLNANLIVFIENDFEIVKEIEALLSKMIYLNENDLEKLLLELNFNTNQYSILFSTFLSRCYVLSIKDQELNKLITAGRIITALEFQADSNTEYMELKALGSTLMDYLRERASQIENFHEIFLKYGIAHFHDSYRNIFYELSKFTPRKSLRFYKSASPPEWDAINQEVISNTSSGEFCLFIVDKKLGDDNDEGERFIKDNISGGSFQNRGINVISILYTSRQVEKEIKTFHDYYTIEVNKQDQDALEHITIGLGTCAYVHIFERLKVIHSNAINEAFELALIRPKNMQFLASMAHEEGITAFEAINKWFDIARKDSIARELLKKQSNLTQYHYILGLTQILSEGYRQTRYEKWDFDTEIQIQRLNTSEIFDYTINQLHLPPAPGDIFEKDGEYFILVGQECDFTVRKDKVERNAKTADLLKCEFIPGISGEKVYIENPSIKFNYFRSSEDETGLLSAQLGGHINADFQVIDLCAFNSDGYCKIDTDKPLDNNVKYVLPKAWDSYFTKLQEYFTTLKQINTILLSQDKHLKSLSNYELSAFVFNLNAEGVGYPLRRLCRLKDEFKNLLLKSYWDYRGRVGLNTITITDTETVSLSKVEIGFLGQEMQTVNLEYEAIMQKVRSREKNKDYRNLPIILNLNDLKVKIDRLSDIEVDEIIINPPYVVEKKSKVTFIGIFEENKLCGVRIIFPYKIIPSNRVLHTKDKVNLMDLLGSEYISTIKKLPIESKYIFTDNQEEFRIFNDQRKPELIDLALLSRGIYVPDIKIGVLLKDNIIIIEPNLGHSEVATAVEKQ